MFLLKDLTEGDLGAVQKQTRESLLEIISCCLRLLKLFVRSNATYKNLLIADIDVFLEFNTLNVGQSDLLSELFTDNKKADKSAQNKMINYFCQKIVSEGCQIRFLEFFDSYVSSRVSELNSDLNIILDIFLPYRVPLPDSDGMKLIYGQINQKNEEFQLYLNDDLEAFTHEQEADLFFFKNEPFLYHHKLLLMFLKMIDSDIKRRVKIRLRKYFSIGYLFRFLSETDCYYEEPAESRGLLSEESLLSKESKEQRYRFGMAFLKPLVSELLFKVYCEEERNIYRTIIGSINNITSLLEHEIMRIRDLAGAARDEESDNLRGSPGEVDPLHRTYVRYLFKVGPTHQSIFVIFESKFNLPCDKSDYEGDVLFRFFEALLDRPEFITATLSRGRIELLKTFMGHGISARKKEVIANLDVGIDTHQTDVDEDLVNKRLEWRASRIEMKEFSFRDIWEIGINEVKSSQKTATNQETDVFADLVHSFGFIFSAELRAKFGINYQVHDFLGKILMFLSSSFIDSSQKHFCLEFFIRFIETSADKTQTQNLLNKIGIIKVCLILLAEIKIQENQLLPQILDLLNKLLEGGNRETQKALHQFFQLNVRHTANLFSQLSYYVQLFSSRVIKDPEFIQGLRYDHNLQVIQKVVLFLQRMCEGHFEELQNYLRVQANLRKKHNFLDMICILLKQCSLNPLEKTFELCSLCIDFLIEMLQGPCFENQKGLIELNLVTDISEILSWRLNGDTYEHKISKKITIKNKTKLMKLKLSREIAEEAFDLDFAEIEKSLQGKYPMSNSRLVKLKYKAMVIMMALLEMQEDKLLISKIRKELNYAVLKKLIVEVYIDFLVKYQGDFKVETLNHVVSPHPVRPGALETDQAHRLREGERVHHRNRLPRFLPADENIQHQAREGRDHQDRLRAPAAEAPQVPQVRQRLARYPPGVPPLLQRQPGIRRPRSPRTITESPHWSKPSSRRRSTSSTTTPRR